ncbi:MAG TPA: cytochrome C biosynthesis protein [Desulfobulbaceae bacterium]|nr:MAG: cytochrome C biosynthesis protein [Deltaproteobacteria bacterium RIFOXYD12_FULL_53_23]HCC54015.1 cytochrome C biosynthesis protein [Desulfobulbaceae bacterium]
MDALFILVNEWMSAGLALAALGCFIWGMISVLLSPCHLASIPLVVAYVGGQEQLVHGRQAVKYALLFSVGLFLTIVGVGVICTLLGRMLGDVGPYWSMAVGLILIWVAVDMLGLAKCSLPGGGLMGRFKLKGAWGAFVLGLAYGVLSGTCTFGFIAPILAIITVQGQVFTGVLLILLFAAGHCLPIAVAGSSTATVRRLLASSSFGSASLWFRRGAGLLIAGLGVYFLVKPLW